MAVTVTYQYPVAGTTAPTAAQMGGSVNPILSKVRATVIAAVDADTTATITHNMGLSAADLAAGRCEVKITPLVQTTAALSLWAVTSVTANTIVLTKATTAGSGGAAAQIQVVVDRPQSSTE